MPWYFFDIASVHLPVISSKFTTFQPLWRLQNWTSVVKNSCCTETAQPLEMRNIMEHHHILHHYAKVQSLIQKSVNWCIELQNRTRLSWSSWSSQSSSICHNLFFNWLKTITLTIGLPNQHRLEKISWKCTNSQTCPDLWSNTISLRP